MNLRSWMLLFVLVGVLPAMALCRGEWFPREGRGAMHQQCLDLRHPAVAMMVSVEPGSEDLRMLAELRLWEGVQTVVVQLTNGEATNGDSLGRFPQFLAGARKEEADRAGERLGAEVWFANLPDLGASASAAELARSWPIDSVVVSLVTAIRAFKPDVVVVCHDWHSAAAMGARDSIVLDAVRRSVQRAATNADTSSARSLFPWTVARVAVGVPGSPGQRQEAKTHFVWGLSPEAMANVIASGYRTLRHVIGWWQKAPRAYYLVNKAGMARNPLGAAGLVSGLPVIPRELAGAKAAIDAALHPVSSGGFRTSLPAVSGAIDTIEHVMAKRTGSYNLLQARMIGLWKNTLEELRCTLLGVRVKAIPSDSLLTNSQVWSLKIDSLAPSTTSGFNEIVFPLAMRGEWSVNETLKYFFPFSAPQEYRILSGEKLPLAYPSGSAGLTAQSMRFTFPYLIYHKDPHRMLNFVFRGEVVFRLGPRRTLDILNPLVIARPGTEIVCRLQNFSRDPFKGRIVAYDSSGATVQTSFSMTAKDQVVTDTLLLPYHERPAEGVYGWTVEIPARAPSRASVTARSFPCASDTSLTIGVLSTVSDSPVMYALKESQRKVVPADSVQDWSAVKTLVVDRDAFSEGEKGSGLSARIVDWIRSGGTLVVFPQQSPGADVCGNLFGVTFTECRPLAPDAAVEQVNSPAWSSPNAITPESWRNWVEARSYETLSVLKEPPGFSTLLRAGKNPQISTFPFGRGRVTFVCLDLWSQLVNLHPGAFQILSNLVAFH